MAPKTTHVRLRDPDVERIDEIGRRDESRADVVSRALDALESEHVDAQPAN